NESSKNLLGLIGEYKKIDNQESRDILDALVKFLSEGMQTSKEKIKKAEKIRVAKNLVKVGVTVDIILQTTGLTADELDAN
ncbi:transcriptional regulator, partial [Wolbachia endosymbiont of Pentalonia nigronervosa]|nr:transcriptional regulator [Wolbachia endosymbiont of Pentalonia nigronervosa]